MAYETSHRGNGLRILVVAARFNEVETDQLLEGALECLAEHDVADDDVDVLRVPGAFEIPGTIGVALRHGRYDGVVAIGCVIRGETPHFDYVAGETARGVQELAVRHDVAIGFGVLTTDTREQALARSGGPHGNKGRDAALATLEMANHYRHLRARAEAE
jgi:6,7-dimethyl-8-ribityllumazine synthase